MVTVTTLDKEPDLKAEWGANSWLCNRKLDPETDLTLGVVEIKPGHSNPRHYHPNCEELVFVLEGECDHSLGDEVFSLKPGQMLRIPTGAVHNAVNTGNRPVRMVIAYSTGERQTVGV